ncbi:ArsI/CadI family heavy metal resistance metalloenzyme [Zavarzinella formosa]|uniref:ArsI/CadI family heavy metal resistance metalloenzyme n=1 Tax=Zavarzinella formosa TaxID=360055 RepID=UPI0002F11EEF|nr:ArsI/CadI family heavy metal resistance metalloenzyme [Zavarzinella formosa]
MSVQIEEAPAVTATGVRFHLGLHSSDLGRSVRFYETLLGAPPVKNLPDYVRFEIADPPLVVALYPNPQVPGGALNHVGLRLDSSESLVELQRRLEEQGISTQRQEGVECCYSRQTKFWVTDPDKTLWEIYTLEEDIDHSGFDDAPVKAAAVEAIWQHRITDPIPAVIPHGDDSLDEVILEGTFNAILPEGALTRLLGEIRRTLKPGGRIAVHGLVGDKPFPGAPKLPGMASLVRRVPVETEALEMLLAAGFGSLAFDKLGDIHCFRVNGVELREMRLAGRKAVKETASALVLYKGPFEQVVAEDGTTLRRGVAVRVSGELAGLLRVGSADQFSFLPE